MGIKRIERDLIKKAIKDAEVKSMVEIVPVILRQSDLYPATHFRVGALVAFTFSVLLYLSPLHFINPLWYLAIQFPGFLVGFMLAYLPLVKKTFITKREIQTEVYQCAIELFYEHKVHLTEKHTGVLILLSSLEQKIEVILDHGLIEKCPPDALQTLINDFSIEMKKGEPYNAMKHLIENLSHLFENYFPRHEPKKFMDNEIKDELIER